MASLSFATILDSGVTNAKKSAQLSVIIQKKRQRPFFSPVFILSFFLRRSTKAKQTPHFPSTVLCALHCFTALYSFLRASFFDCSSLWKVTRIFLGWSRKRRDLQGDCDKKVRVPAVATVFGVVYPTYLYINRYYVTYYPLEKWNMRNFGIPKILFIEE